ncbi:hypothetical protein SprV_1002910400 [Sparganum proliferum]
MRGEQFGTQSSRRRWPSSVAHPATYNLLSEKGRLQKAYIDHLSEDGNIAAFYHCRRLVQQQLREMQNARTACKAMEIQGYADHNEWKNFFSAIYCPPAKRTAPLLSADGNTPLTEKTQILLSISSDAKLTAKEIKIETAILPFLSLLLLLLLPRYLHLPFHSSSSSSSSSSSFPPPISPDWYDNPGGTRPERKTALIAREQARYKVDIIALKETRFSEQGQLEEVAAGYTFFCSGRYKAKRQDAGVTFAIRNDIVGRLPCLPQGINDRLLSLRLPRWGGEITILVTSLRR